MGFIKKKNRKTEKQVATGHRSVVHHRRMLVVEPTEDYRQKKSLKPTSSNSTSTPDHLPSSPSLCSWAAYHPPLTSSLVQGKHVCAPKSIASVVIIPLLSATQEEKEEHAAAHLLFSSTRLPTCQPSTTVYTSFVILPSRQVAVWPDGHLALAAAGPALLCADL